MVNLCLLANAQTTYEIISSTPLLWTIVCNNKPSKCEVPVHNYANSVLVVVRGGGGGGGDVERQGVCVLGVGGGGQLAYRKIMSNRINLSNLQAVPSFKIFTVQYSITQ